MRVAALAAVFVCAGAIHAGGGRVSGFDRITVDHGLSQSGVNCIYQDRSGMMWFGTENGLNRFDGFDFTVFHHDTRRPGSLSKDYIWSIYEDRRHRLWVGTDGGLNQFRRLENDFLHWRHDPDTPQSLSNNIVRSIAEAKDGALWIGTDGGGLDRFDPDSGGWTHFRHDPQDPTSLGNDRIRVVFFDSNHRMWIGTYGAGLARFDPASGVFSHVELSDTPLEVYSIAEEPGGALWVGTHNRGLYRYDPHTEQIEWFSTQSDRRQRLPGDAISAVVIDPADKLWVATDQGLVERSLRDGTSVVHVPDPSDDKSLSSELLTSLFADRGGVLWAGTKASGLNKYALGSAAFRRYQHIPDAPSISHDIVTAFAKDTGGDLWVGTFGGGLNRFDAATGEIRHFGSATGSPRIKDTRVMSLLSMPDGTVWVGTRSHGLHRVDTASDRVKQFQHVNGDPGSLPGNGIVKLYRDRQDGLWAGVFDAGVARFEPETGTFRTFEHDPDDPTGLPSNRITAIVEDRAGALWLGFDGAGLCRLDRESGSCTSVRREPDKLRPLSSDDIYSLHVSSDDTLWIGTQGSGLNAWRAVDRARGRRIFESYDEHDGLANNHVYGILEDKFGRLWLSTNRGLSCFDPGKREFRNYNTSHGLQSNEFNFGAYYRADDGEMFFGGIAGYNSFFPEDLDSEGFRPPVVLTSVMRLNEPMPVDPREVTVEGLTLTHQDYVTSFRFAALDYSAPTDTRYAYRLTGLHDDWIELGNSRMATFTNLPAGHYRLQVKGTNGNGDWSPHTLDIPLTMLPPPWKTWWAYSTYVLLVGWLILWYVRGQRQRLHREEEYSRKLESEVEARTRELAERNADLEELNDRLQAASVTDPLTGLHNRRYLSNRIEEDIATLDRRRMRRSDDAYDILFLMVDLDGLKTLNDQYGHLVGDRAILQMATLLKQTCRGSDTIVRWGGDEFMVVARDISLENAETLAERIRERVERQSFVLDDGTGVKLSCSIGFAFYPFLPDAPDSLSWEQVVGLADQALYVSKRGGRNRWACLLANERTPKDDLYDRLTDDASSMMSDGVVDLRWSGPDPVAGGSTASPPRLTPR